MLSLTWKNRTEYRRNSRQQIRSPDKRLKFGSIIVFYGLQHVDSDELKEEIYLRQMMGIPDVTPRILRISCRCCSEPITSVSLHWRDHYKPRQALPCLMCGHPPILTASCSWHGGHRMEWRTNVSYWIMCKCGPRQEFSARKIVPHPARSHISIPHTAVQLIGEWNRMLRHKIKANQL